MIQYWKRAAGLFLLAACAAGRAAEPVAEDAPRDSPWLHSSISGIIGTNAPLESAQRRDLAVTLRNLAVEASQTSHVYAVEAPTISSLFKVEPGSNTLDMAQVAILLDETMTIYRRGEMDKALARMTNGLLRLKSPEARSMAYDRMGMLYFRAGNYRMAVDNFRLASDLRPLADSPRLNLAAALMSAGRYSEAERTIRVIVASSIRDRTMRFSICFNMACIRSMERNVIDALLWLGLAAREDTPATLASLSDAQLDPIRDEPGFHSIRDVLLDYKPPFSQSEYALEAGLHLGK